MHYLLTQKQNALSFLHNNINYKYSANDPQALALPLLSPPTSTTKKIKHIGYSDKATVTVTNFYL